ncbi:MAG: DNA polymerase III subunit chi [Methylotenera sp.]|nr:MAG: DNA polymerase III subunit chi [Methylotenera sp.]
MTKIEFYSNVANKQDLLASLVEKALLKRSQVTVFTENVSSATEASECLWQQQAASFLPHVMATHPHAAKTPIIIACKNNIAGQIDTIIQDELLINLTTQEPPFFSRFTHLVEMVGDDESDKQNGRLRYKFYRDRGYEIRHIDYAKQAEQTLTAVSAE